MWKLCHQSHFPLWIYSIIYMKWSLVFPLAYFFVSSFIPFYLCCLTWWRIPESTQSYHFGWSQKNLPLTSILRYSGWLCSFCLEKSMCLLVFLLLFQDITWQDEHSAPFSWETKVTLWNCYICKNCQLVSFQNTEYSNKLLLWGPEVNVWSRGIARNSRKIVISQNKFQTIIMIKIIHFTHLSSEEQMEVQETLVSCSQCEMYL